jgi:hypothetical protein
MFKAYIKKEKLKNIAVLFPAYYPLSKYLQKYASGSRFTIINYYTTLSYVSNFSHSFCRYNKGDIGMCDLYMLYFSA